MHTFIVELDDIEIDAFLMTYDYQELIPNRTTDPVERKRHPQVPNPLAPDLFVQQVIEQSIEKIVDSYVGQQAARNAHQAAVEAHRAEHPRRRDRR